MQRKNKVRKKVLKLYEVNFNMRIDIGYKHKTYATRDSTSRPQNYKQTQKKTFIMKHEYISLVLPKTQDCMSQYKSNPSVKNSCKNDIALSFTAKNTP